MESNTSAPPRFTLHISMIDPAHYLPVAQAAEKAGFDNIGMGDSICYPRESDSKYPYTADGNREFLENKPFLEPFTIIPAMAAVTTRIGFDTGVLKMPLRNPVVLAKQVASLAVVTGNRFKLGVGTSPWPDDYEICGVPWERRGKRMEEMIQIVRGLCRGDYFEFHGELIDFRAIKLVPAPDRPVPITIGGHSQINIRRAARLADGWIPSTNARESLAPMIADLRRHLEEFGRVQVPFEIHGSLAQDATRDDVERLRELGCTDFRVRLTPAYTLDSDHQPVEAKFEFIERFADRVVHAVAA
jgi:probable F420-dependent oxidoreductase